MRILGQIPLAEAPAHAESHARACVGMQREGSREVRGGGQCNDTAVTQKGLGGKGNGLIEGFHVKEAEVGN